ncbi:MAG: HYR domain-containing protein [Acidobacteria bacterium]|nr:HYR domain-containing protein [Acidobacteriota bacterium]
MNDTEPPTIQCADITTDNDPGQCTAIVSFSPQVNDNCPGQLSVVCNPSSGSAFPVGVTTVTCTVTDPGGSQSTCSFTVTVNDTESPTIQCADLTTDNDPGQCSAVVIFSPQVSDNCLGQLTVVCSPSSGSAFPVGVTTVTCTVTDPGGNQSACTFTVTVTDIEPPVIISCPPAITVATFDDLPPCDGSDVQATDNCGFTVECIPCAAGGVGCTDNPITSSYIYIVTDAAGNADTCTRVVIISAPDCPTMAIAIGGGQETMIVPVGSQVSIPIQLNTNEFEIGSFDLLLGYDRAVMSLIAAERGTAVAAWEYFTYRLGSNEDCTDDCPSGTIRLMGVADLSNGSAPPAEAYALDGVIANLTFEVSTDQDLAGLETAVSQYNRDCLSNVIRSRDGEVSYTVVDLATDPCLSEFSGKAVISSVTIEAGLIRIGGPGNGRGDLNLNGMAYEVGDAVLLSSYFMHGDGVFSDDPAMRAQQILASDINNDGVVLSVGDLVYLIRVLTGEAAPAGQLKRSPYAATGSITYRVENGAMTVSTTSSVDLGGALFVFRYSGVSVGTPVLAAAASDLRLTSRAGNGELRVLISSDARSVSAARVAAGTNHLFTVPVDGEGRLELVESQLSDAEGSLMSVLTAHASIPTGFSLLQNYPNPFNAGTVIPFELGREGDWMIQVYNVAGQAIRTFSGHGAAGRYQVSWNGTDESGTAVSSGMYFYRIVSGDFAATRKMVLLK